MISKQAIHKLTYLLKKHLNFELNHLDISFVNYDEMIMINKKYLNHNYSTDVITFNYSDNTKLIDGEIIICEEVAKQNAARYSVNPKAELLRLVVHGILHLLGFTDSELNQRKLMKRKENQLVRKYAYLVK